MSVAWRKVGDVTLLGCDMISCDGLLVCTHTFDFMTHAAPEDLQIPDGRVALPMAGEFPRWVSGGMFGAQESLTEEKVGAFAVLVSAPLNDYGTRSIELPTTEGSHFLMMLNPEDAIVSIYETTQEFINSQVAYKEGDRFGNCSGPSHRIGMQAELDFLVPFLDLKPMLRMWDLLGKLQFGSCVVCMWKRGAANVNAGSTASGLGNL